MIKQKDTSGIHEAMTGYLINNMQELSSEQREWLKTISRLDIPGDPLLSFRLFSNAYFYFLDNKDSNIYKKWDQIISESDDPKAAIEALIKSICQSDIIVA